MESYSPEELEEWENYKTKFNKKYDETENSEKREIYFKNKKWVEEHNAKHDKGEVSYRVSINQFSDKKLNSS